MSGSDGEWSPWGDDDETERPLISTGEQQHMRPPPGMEDTDRLTAPLVGGRTYRRTQYATAFAATLGAMAMGTVLGYSSPAGARLTNTTDTSDFLHLTKVENSWFSSVMNIGALVGGPVGGLSLNRLGRRMTLITNFASFVVGWLVLAFARNVEMLMVGRVITGMCAGIISVAVPTYIGEFASSDIRGTLGSGFQLMVTLGVLYSYGLGAVVPSWRWLSGLCIIPVFLHFILMIFVPESPSFLLFKGKEREAAVALQFFRGRDTNIQTELDMMRASVEERLRNRASLRDLAKPYILKPLLIALSLMFFQQFSGVNGILFNLTIIFSTSGSAIPDDVSSIIVGGVQVLATFLATVLMDRAGRKLLLIASSSVMALSLLAMGEFFYMKGEYPAWASANLGWLPLLSLMVYIAAFSIGYGPVPWLMMGELFSPNVKELAATQVSMVNWTLAFVVTFIFTPLKTAVGDAWMYWIFAGLCVLSLVFSVCVVPETKGKTLEEITASFGGPTAPARRNSSDC